MQKVPAASRALNSSYSSKEDAKQLGYKQHFFISHSCQHFGKFSKALVELLKVCNTTMY